MSDRTPAEWLLEQWGLWARTNSGSVKGYPHIDTVARLRGSTVPEPLITDAQASLIDGLVGQLHLEHPREAASLALRHVHRLPLAKVAGELRCSRSAAHSLVRAGTMWLDGRLSVELPEWM